MKKFIGMTLLVLVIVVAYNVTSYAGPTVYVGVNVPQAQQIPAERIDHRNWNALLAKYVDKAGMVDYQTWKATATDAQALDQYLNHLSAAAFSQNTKKEVKLAFWINAYNAVTVKGILREYPTKSIRDHTAKLIGYNIWKDLQLVVAGKPISLEDIEHKVLRKMGEPRIHFAIVCASIGCPRLLNEAFMPETMDRQLTINAQAFFADPSKFRADAAHNTVFLSPILDWFGEDFGKSKADQLRTIAPLLPEAAQALATSGNAKVKFLGYDWGLNDRKPTARQASR